MSAGAGTLRSWRRIDGNPRSRVIYYLPWKTSFELAKSVGLIPLDYLACYKMPAGLLSSDPARATAAIEALHEDTKRLVAARGADPSQLVCIGLSIGNFPATYIANTLGAKLLGVAPADRGELLVWQSPLALFAKEDAVRQGRTLGQFAEAFAPYNPVNNIARLAPKSAFIWGTRDRIVPRKRTLSFLKAMRIARRTPNVRELPLGHFSTLLLSGRYQKAFL